MLMIVGIGFIAILTGAIAERFLAGEIEEVAEASAETEATEAELLVESPFQVSASRTHTSEALKPVSIPWTPVVQFPRERRR